MVRNFIGKDNLLGALVNAAPGIINKDMSSNLLTLKLWGREGPNPSKVAYVLEELQLPYETIPIGFSEVKSPEFLAINPNGRMPALNDPNTGITLWETGAIIEYLIDKYDESLKVSFLRGSEESYLAKQWLFFQVSGQGPYFGQAAWFVIHHPEPVPSAIDRYIREVNRITSVLENQLSKTSNMDKGDGPWLVGNRFSFADLAFVPFQNAMEKMLSKNQYDIEKYPNVKLWLNKMNSRESVKKFLLVGV